MAIQATGGGRVTNRVEQIRIADPLEHRMWQAVVAPLVAGADDDWRI